MELDNKKKLEIALGIVFVALLILVVILVVSSAGGSKITTTTTIENSFNTYNIYTQPLANQLVYTDAKPYIIDKDDTRAYVDRDFRYTRSYASEYLGYDSWAQRRTTKGVIGRDIEIFEVYLTNLDYMGGYFTVKYYFEDYYGRVNTESVTHYIKPRSEELFVLKNISPDKYDYRAWWYEVVSQTKTPTKVYYSS
jgi:hypothetical protein